MNAVLQTWWCTMTLIADASMKICSTCQNYAFLLIHLYVRLQRMSYLRKECGQSATKKRAAS